MVKNMPLMQETRVRSLGQQYPLEKGMATHSSILVWEIPWIEDPSRLLEKAMAPHSSTLAWKIPWTEEPGRLQSMGSLRVGHDWVASLSLFTFTRWRRKWQPTGVLAWRIPGMGEPGGLPSMGSHRVGHDWSDLAAAAGYSPWDHTELGMIEQVTRKKEDTYNWITIVQQKSTQYFKSSILKTFFKKHKN